MFRRTPAVGRALPRWIGFCIRTSTAASNANINADRRSAGRYDLSNSTAPPGQFAKRILLWTPKGHRKRRRLPPEIQVLALTPPSIVGVLAAWRHEVHNLV